MYRFPGCHHPRASWQSRTPLSQIPPSERECHCADRRIMPVISRAMPYVHNSMLSLSRQSESLAVGRTLSNTRATDLDGLWISIACRKGFTAVLNLPAPSPPRSHWTAFSWRKETELTLLGSGFNLMESQLYCGIMWKAGARRPKQSNQSSVQVVARYNT